MVNDDSGLVFTAPHFPGRAPIDAYGDGRFKFAEMAHTGSLLCLPSGILPWPCSAPESFDAEAFSAVIAEAGEIDILLVGTGNDLRPLAPGLKALFRSHAISADAMSTGAAVRTYNVLLAENRAVAAALIAVE
ncbi:uncharacterized protein GGD81_001186 [Rhodobium orientis]|uniref:Xcc1710-like domain-containing protein n=1 Tax=Rhodobium orientis TaxID=34017 RepID=A0A327JSS0_9HYPH|nr:MTH938/NDUFAF3 family protein [Rhodobium orientis]MBB4302159.1 uncharacterized protein [Rhodobium orientis]MBK5948870.1 hypothetical protein [Rhodobium orientis]RAI27942.1 hypothetical protein CH339_08550 [Rhodobium orientis]